MDFFEAYMYLHNHPMFDDKFLRSLYVEVVKVCPETLCIEDDQAKNTQTRVWLECGPVEGGFFYHDIRLDCGGDTFEDAIVELAKLVKEHYPLEKEKAQD